MSRRLPVTLAILALSALLFLVACDDEEGAPATPTATTAATAALSPTAPAIATETPEPVPTGSFEGTHGPVEGCPPGPHLAFLVDVRTGRHEGFDRVVFEFSEGPGFRLPCYRVEYIEPPIVADPSGLPVDIDGNAFLQVRFEPGSAVELGGPEPRITCCRSEITTGFPSLVDLKETGDFEAVLTYVLGLTEEVDFRVFELEDPPRIAMDVAHP